MDSFDTDVLLSYYGDDFTGSTDVMESLSLNGIPTALFLQPPTPSEVKTFRLKNKNADQDQLRAFGVAGVSRSMTPVKMDQSLPGIFEKISRIKTRFFHYKICSTFDSSPEVGNIGHAVDIALRYFPSAVVPLVVASPRLNRFCVFGNLFARVGDTVFRLDRHPTMSRHPVTPMHESDLVRHLAAQTPREVSLIDALALSDSRRATSLFRNTAIKHGRGFVLFDVLHEHHLVEIGRLISEETHDNQLLVGSSALENALVAYREASGNHCRSKQSWFAGEARRVVAMSGSCSPVSQRQIEWAMANGFQGVRINTVALADPDLSTGEVERIITTSLEALENRNIVLFTALGPEDPAITETKTAMEKFYPGGDGSETMASCQGEIVRAIVSGHPAIRVVIAGGDTSGWVSRALDIRALEVLAPISPGAPLCIAHSTNAAFDGLQIALKGGQNGGEKYFQSILKGHSSD